MCEYTCVDVCIHIHIFWHQYQTILVILHMGFTQIALCNSSLLFLLMYNSPLLARPFFGDIYISLKYLLGKYWSREVTSYLGYLYILFCKL